MDIYTRSFRVLSGDVDPSLTLKVSTLFTWFQEAAMTHTIEMGITRQRTLDLGILWVVVQYRIRITRLPSYDEAVTLSSWPGRDMHLFFTRYFSLTGPDGEPFADASSFWAMMSKETRELVYPASHGITIPGTVTGKEIPLPSRIRGREPEKTAVFTVPYSYLDLNGHMNNARYFDLASDQMDEETRSLPITELSADFIGEARYGDELTLGIYREKDRFQISGKRDKDVFRLDYRFRT